MPTPLSRRRVLRSAGLGVAAVVREPVATIAVASEYARQAATSPHQALQLLIAGNRRWVTGRVTHPHISRSSAASPSDTSSIHSRLSSRASIRGFHPNSSSIGASAIWPSSAQAPGYLRKVW